VSESATIRDRDNVSGPRELADPVHHHAGERLPDLFWASLLTGWETPLRYVTRLDATSRDERPESKADPLVGRRGGLPRKSHPSGQLLDAILIFDNLVVDLSIQF